MPIDFFKYPCTEHNGNCQKPGIVCRSTTREINFGICDDLAPSVEPAYTDLAHMSKWNAEVFNEHGKEVTFKAIDYCVPLLRPNGDMERRCDGMLVYSNTLIFIELKDRAHSGWIAHGLAQLKSTILAFRANHGTNQLIISEAYVCNKQRPLAVTGISTLVQQFRNEVGVRLIVNRRIEIR